MWAVYEPLTFHRTAAMIVEFADALAEGYPAIAPEMEDEEGEGEAEEDEGEAGDEAEDVIDVDTSDNGRQP